MLEFLLAAVVLILFYKLVKSEHKLLLFKGLGGLAALAILVGAAIGLWYYSQQQQYTAAAARVSLRVVSVTPDTATFQVCNETNRVVHRLEFSVRGIQQGRSSDNSIVEKFGYDSNRLLPALSGRPPSWVPSATSQFQWDLIVQPGSCIAASYVGEANKRRYRQFPKYTTIVDTIVFSDSSSVGQTPVQKNGQGFDQCVSVEAGEARLACLQRLVDSALGQRD